MASVLFYNRIFSCSEGQTVLDVLLENGQDVPYSCKMGVCVTCVMQVVEGGVPAQAQEGLRDSLAAQGHFLPCVCQPTTDITVTNIAEQDLFSPAVVLDIDPLTPDICRIFLEPTTPLYYHAGQFVNLRREDGLVRSYSLASVPSQDDRLEFHVKRLEKGQMSNWILDDLEPGHHLGIQGPTGNCFYEPGRADQKMLLIGNGTGLAPLIGIARDALAAGHIGSINLYHGSQTLAGLYLGDDLRELEAAHSNFSYIPCVSRGDAAEGYRPGRADDVAFSEHAGLKDWRIFLCGYPPMVHCANDRALRAGAAIADIYTDPYELKELRETPRS
ncbi:MAG: 2Fe-2S iron-sulfur cluster binding domain-containing protein [Rhodospirillales bacterium]|nr:2Fe-2S iron-sulfur cluster binding domain-containing protein [Rhodospirillales bacterium]